MFNICSNTSPPLSGIYCQNVEGVFGSVKSITVEREEHDILGPEYIVKTHYYGGPIVTIRGRDLEAIFKRHRITIIPHE